MYKEVIKYFKKSNNMYRYNLKISNLLINEKSRNIELKYSVKTS
jgi:hypothetical protein